MEAVQKDLSYASVIGAMNNILRNKATLEREVKEYEDKLYEAQANFVAMINAQKILSTLADQNTDRVLKFITGIVNKVLSEIFQNDGYSIRMERKLFAGSRPHVLIEIVDRDGNILDSSVQCGTGLIQIISFIYVICCIEVRKGRRLMISDEKLNGLHKSAKSLMSHIIQIFTEGGWQFIFVEYALNDLGKLYNVERRGNESKIVPVDGDYDDTCIFTGEVDLGVLDKDFVEEEEE